MKFPLVEAFLLCPEEGEKGDIGICTNMIAPTMVINEIPFEKRNRLSVLGSLVVSRDGAERMIVNSLIHEDLQYIILFGEETLSFRPSTNLLLALMKGYSEGNVIKEGQGISHHYPSISPELLNLFRKNILVLPIYKHSNSKEIIEEYLNWIKEKIPTEIHECLLKINQKKKIYYDSLLELILIISKTQKKEKTKIELDPKEFQHLQPPIIKLEDIEEKITVPFETLREGNNIRVNIDFFNHPITILGEDSFLMGYSIMDYMNKNNLTLSNEEQLLLGVEMSRIEIEIRNDIKTESFVISDAKETKRTEIEVANIPLMKADKKFYYKVGLKEGSIYVQSLAHDTCTSVFELRANTLTPLIKKLVSENRFEDYEQQALHRIDVGIETGRALIALKTGNSFFQDFRNLFTINKDKFPLIITEADTFLTNHQKIITKLYTTGLTMQHPDTHKGLMRSGTILAAYRNSEKTLEKFPAIYSSGSQSTEDMRKSYKEQLLTKENQGKYTYGNRTREHFGKDQLEEAAEKLNSNKSFVIQRFDYVKDMTLTETEIIEGDKIRKRLEATKDPCLTHDIYFILNGKLHSFHIARAHNIVNAYPENIFGLHDAYDEFISQKLGIPLGDMFVLSSRANILLLTEEQKAKKLIAEPAKPVENLDSSSGPYNITKSLPLKGVGYVEIDLNIVEDKPEHPCLTTLENYEGINLIEKASDYLVKRKNTHNNPIIGTYNPKSSEINETNRLIFIQCNNRGEKIQMTAVFLNGSANTKEKDIELCNYIATQYSKKLNVNLGKLFMFYVPILENE